MIEFLIADFEEFGDNEAIIWKDRSYSYRWLQEKIQSWPETICTAGIPAPVTFFFQSSRACCLALTGLFMALLI